ncbi:hypothetical protein [Galactobacter caseinivorans]|uniref:Uncharacterized protein n=1 Tax=Galactobacter caseinivorans TaxID=2676123 RepID=A0A496PJU2_9MICC|nr:hypothetical protein [Galactobacter caseinivorans]RKW70765.1 hypothetical protein DWQ67_06610 [Galactobacter caseinivorans]
MKATRIGALSDDGPQPKPHLGEGPATLGCAHVTAASEQHRIDAVAWARHGEEIHQLILRDTAGHGLDRFEVPTRSEAWVRVLTHPGKQVALFEYAMDQEGALLLAAWTVDGKLKVRELLGPDDAVCAGFDVAGERLLLLPYPSAPPSPSAHVRVLSWPGLEMEARLEASVVDDQRGWGSAGCIAHDGSLLLTVPGVGLFHIGAEHGHAQPVVLTVPDGASPALLGPDIDEIRHLGERRYAVRSRHQGARLTTEWELN